MTRILCLWFPNWGIQRAIRFRPALRGRPVALVTVGVGGKVAPRTRSAAGKSTAGRASSGTRQKSHHFCYGFDWRPLRARLEACDKKWLRTFRWGSPPQPTIQIVKERHSFPLGLVPKNGHNRFVGGDSCRRKKRSGFTTWQVFRRRESPPTLRGEVDFSQLARSLIVPAPSVDDSSSVRPASFLAKAGVEFLQCLWTALAERLGQLTESVSSSPTALARWHLRNGVE
jgi:hypothetical protein